MAITSWTLHLTSTYHAHRGCPLRPDADIFARLDAGRRPLPSVRAEAWDPLDDAPVDAAASGAVMSRAHAPRFFAVDHIVHGVALGTEGVGLTWAEPSGYVTPPWPQTLGRDAQQLYAQGLERSAIRPTLKAVGFAAFAGGYLAATLLAPAAVALWTRGSGLWTPLALIVVAFVVGAATLGFYEFVAYRRAGQLFADLSGLCWILERHGRLPPAGGLFVAGAPPRAAVALADDEEALLARLEQDARAIVQAAARDCRALLGDEPPGRVAGTAPRAGRRPPRIPIVLYGPAGVSPTRVGHQFPYFAV